MNLKKTLFGFGAATVLSLSMMSGAMAQDISADVDVKLKAGICTLSLGPTLGTQTTFGVWEWKGEATGYVNSGNKMVRMTGTVKNGKPGGVCTIGVKSDGLGADKEIGPENITVSTSNPSFTDIQLSNTFQNGRGFQDGPASADFTLNQVPSNAQPGTHQGKIDFQIANGA